MPIHGHVSLVLITSNFIKNWYNKWTININLATTHQILQFHNISISGKQSYS